MGVERNDACPRVSFSVSRFYFWYAMEQRYRTKVGVQCDVEVCKSFPVVGSSYQVLGAVALVPMGIFRFNLAC